MSDEERAPLLEGKKIYTISYMPSGGGRNICLEQEMQIATFRRFLPAEGERKHDLIQFYESKGGMRTIAVKDIVDYTGKPRHRRSSRGE